MNKTKSGFTIVELLIVIVVIAILAAISILAYNGIQDRANDTAIKSDLANIAKKLELYRTLNGVYPAGDTQPGVAGIKVSKSAYGNGMLGNTYNLLYCRTTNDGPDSFAIIAGSKSSKVFTYKSQTQAISQASAWTDINSSLPNCQAAGINQVGIADRDFFYQSSAWRTYVN